MYADAKFTIPIILIKCPCMEMPSYQKCLIRCNFGQVRAVLHNDGLGLLLLLILHVFLAFEMHLGPEPAFELHAVRKDTA